MTAIVSESADEIVFYAKGLQSKWGFGDGDMLDDLLYEHIGTDEEIDHTFGGRDKCGALYTLKHAVLILAVERFVVPALDQTVDTFRLYTIHNPIRAERINGDTDIEDYTLTPAAVAVPGSAIRAIADEIVRRPAIDVSEAARSLPAPPPRPEGQAK